jgi:hypothetical protein
MRTRHAPRALPNLNDEFSAPSGHHIGEPTPTLDAHGEVPTLGHIDQRLDVVVLGVRIALVELGQRQPDEQRIEGAGAVGEHKTSMLQDLEAGRELELEPLAGAFKELGELTGVPTPSIDAEYSCTKLLAETRLATS